MDPNTHSTDQAAGYPTRPTAGPSADQPTGPVPGISEGLAGLAAALAGLAAHDPDQLPSHARDQRILELRRLLDGLEGHWRKELAAVDARGRRRHPGPLHGQLVAPPPAPEPRGGQQRRSYRLGPVPRPLDRPSPLRL